VTPNPALIREPVEDAQDHGASGESARTAGNMVLLTAVAGGVDPAETAERAVKLPGGPSSGRPLRASGTRPELPPPLNPHRSGS